MEENIDKLGKEKWSLSLILKGMCMGIAEVIPGVSGGTIAFITGIYKKLIDSIKAFDLKTITLLFNGDFKKVWSKINGPFLTLLLLGMGIGVVLGVFGVSHMLSEFPEILWAFFFGLILASVPMMLSTIKEKSIIVILSFIVAVVLAYIITCLSPVEASESKLYIFLCGMIAIVALVLPGVSGSFILLLLGAYTIIIPLLKGFLSNPTLDAFVTLAVFGIGCLTGLFLFVRLVSKAYNDHYNVTIGLMSGFMLGSLNKIWPWRNPKILLDKDKAEIINVDNSNHQLFDILDHKFKILQETNVFPNAYYYNDHLWMVLIAFVAGVLMVCLLHKFSVQNKVTI